MEVLWLGYALLRWLLVQTALLLALCDEHKIFIATGILP